MGLANDITYSGKLKCVSELIANSRLKFSINENLTSLMNTLVNKSIVFIDTSDLIKKISNDEYGDLKTSNDLECKIVTSVTEKLHYYSMDCSNPDSIGIIAPYNNQVKTIQNAFRKKSDSTFFKDIETNTVDQFQGRDKKVVVVSFTRSILKSEENRVRNN